MIGIEGDYCPECGYQTYTTTFPGNNGMVVKEVCSMCGWLGRPEV